MFLSACVVTNSVSEIKELEHDSIRTSNSNAAKNAKAPARFLGENNEMKCLGDLSSTYEMWTVEPGNAQNEKYTITILPVTNQTNYADKEIPREMTLSAQRIATQLGSGYNIVFAPSLTDAQSGFYTKWNDFFKHIEEPGKLGSHSTPPSNKNIVIIAALTEYDDPNRSLGENGNFDLVGSKNKKSFGAGASSDLNRYTGRMSMTFSIAYPARVGNFSEPQLVYHPDSSVNVTLDFKESVNNNEFSFSYDGGKPSIGYKNKFHSRDSRFIAMDLLIERGILKALGRYHNVPYWRCMTENQIEKKDGIPLSQLPLPLKDTQQMLGYDSHVEHTVRRTFRYISNDLNLGPYTRRPKYQLENGQKWAVFAQYNISPDQADEFIPTNYEGDYIVKQVSDEEFNRKWFDPNQCNEFYPQVHQVQDMQNLEQGVNAGTTQTVVQGDFKKFNQCLIQKFSYPQGQGYLVGSYDNNQTKQYFNYALKQVFAFNTEQLEKANSLPVQLKGLLARTLYQHQESKDAENDFVSLWMSAPYLPNARIYPYYLEWDKDKSEQYIPNLINWGIDSGNITAKDKSDE